MKLALFIFLVIVGLTSATSQNILISDENNQCEPSIKMHPNNPDILVAGTLLKYYHTSNDGGQTWQTRTLTSPYGVWGDPVIDVDHDGNFYYTHLSNTPDGNFIDRIVCQKSQDNGLTWNDGSYTGLNGDKAQDKQWSIIDEDGTIYITWTQFDDYGSSDPEDKSAILFSKSVDQGNSWSNPIEINTVYGNCLDGDDSLVGAVPALGPNNELYVAWAGPDGIVFNKSMNGGETWLDSEIQINPMPGGWAIDIPGIYRANGLPVTKCDLSNGSNNGTIYVNWADQRNGEDNTDIWLSKSIDGGANWTEPVKVNTDTSNKHQFFTWMDIDQTTGDLYFIFYDRRHYEDNSTDVYLARSTDGGETFDNFKISESPFVPNKGIFFGDYNNIIAHDGIIRPIWTRLHEGKLSIWTDVSPLDAILSIEEVEEEYVTENIRAYPNPTTSKAYISFKLRRESKITLKLYDVNGKVVKLLINNQNLGYGKHIIPVEIGQLNMASGSYFYGLSIDGENQGLKKLLVD